MQCPQYVGHISDVQCLVGALVKIQEFRVQTVANSLARHAGRFTDGIFMLHRAINVSVLRARLCLSSNATQGFLKQAEFDRNSP